MNIDPVVSLSPQRPVLLQSMTGPKVLGHVLIARTLKACGVTHVYGITGTPVDETLGACAAEGIRVIGVRHQQGATLMAAAHNYVAGALRAAVIVSAGPAVTNCATGLLVGYDNAWPLLVIGGRRPLAQRSQGAFQELDGAALFTTITKHSALVARAEEIPPCLSWACREVMAGRPGPVYMDIAEEALDGLAVPSTSPKAIAVPASFPEPQAIEAAAVLIACAQRPVLLFGKGARWSEPWAELRQLYPQGGGRLCPAGFRLSTGAVGVYPGGYKGAGSADPKTVASSIAALSRPYGIFRRRLAGHRQRERPRSMRQHQA